MAKITPETKLKRACTKIIKDLGGYSLPIPGGSFGVSGAPDRIVFFRGVAYAVEFKAPGRKLGPKQEEVKNNIERAGCPYVIAWTVDDFKASLGIKTLFKEDEK